MLAQGLRFPGLLTRALEQLPGPGSVVIYGLFAGLIGLPLLTVLLQAVIPGLFELAHPDLSCNAAPVLLAFGSLRVATAVLHSLKMGAAVVVLATVVGGLFAVLVQRFDLPLRPAIMLSCLAIFADVLSDFGLATGIARTANFGVLTYAIYAAASDCPVDFPMAGTQARLGLSALRQRLIAGDGLCRHRLALVWW